MKRMTNDSLRDMSIGQLSQSIRDMRRQVLELRLQMMTSSVKGAVTTNKALRKSIARALTIHRQKTEMR